MLPNAKEESTVANKKNGNADVSPQTVKVFFANRLLKRFYAKKWRNTATISSDIIPYQLGVPTRCWPTPSFHSRSNTVSLLTYLTLVMNTLHELAIRLLYQCLLAATGGDRLSAERARKTAEKGG